MRRIKTKEEFEKQYGKNWKSRIRFSWNSEGMNFAFGTELTEGEEFSLKDLHAFIRVDKDGFSWKFSEDMVKEVTTEICDE